MQHAKSVAEIEEKIFGKWKTLLGVVLLAYDLGGAKLECSLPPRLGRRHAGAQILPQSAGQGARLLSSWKTVVGALSGGEIRKTNAKKRRRRSHSRSSAFERKEARDDRRVLIPIAGLRLQLFSASHGKAIEAGATVVFRGTPLRGDRAFMLKLEQQGDKACPG